MHDIHVDNHPAIDSGREFGAFPKKLGSPRLQVDSDPLVGTLDHGAAGVATATIGYEHFPLDLEEARAEVATPTSMPKIMRDYAGAPRICERVPSFRCLRQRSSITTSQIGESGRR